MGWNVLRAKKGFLRVTNRFNLASTASCYSKQGLLFISCIFPTINDFEASPTQQSTILQPLAPNIYSV